MESVRGASGMASIRGLDLYFDAMSQTAGRCLASHSS